MSFGFFLSPSNHTVSDSQALHACMLSRFSRVQLFATLWTLACQTPLSMGLSRKNTGVGCHALLQGIFPIQESNPHLFRLQHWPASSLPLVPPEKFLSTRTVLFFLLINISLALLLSIFVEILFCKAEGPGPCHWPLV